MLPCETIASFKKGDLELWCPKMIIRQQESDKPFEYVGSGLIRQNQENRLEFVLIESCSPSLTENVKRMLRNTGGVGKLLPPDEYYSLEADDLSGWKWKADRLRVSRCFGPAGSIALGDIYILEHIDSSESQNITIKIEIFSDAKIPFTGAIKTIKTVLADRDELVSYKRNMARSKAGQFEFIITYENSILTIVATSETANAPENIETRIVEALRYITSRTLSWGTLQKTANGKSITCLRSPDKGQLSTNLSLPIDYIRSIQTGKWAWLLFEKYLEHICDFKGKNRFQMHPLSAWLNFIRNNSSGTIFTKGLGLGIAVEGILESEFSNIGLHDNKYTDAVKAIFAYVKSFTGCEKVKEKALGTLGAMQNVRAIDKLLFLQSEGFVRADDVKAWNAVRNRGAHAMPPESDDLQEWIDNCYKTEVLINHLIFHVIGYEGEFTDYGNRNKGWPQAHYPVSNTSSTH